MKSIKVYQDDKNFYLIMEYCKGGELFDYLVDRDKFSEDEAAIIMK
jgi:serine/threonine protein kinase